MVNGNGHMTCNKQQFPCPLSVLPPSGGSMHVTTDHQLIAAAGTDSIEAVKLGSGETAVGEVLYTERDHLIGQSSISLPFHSMVDGAKRTGTFLNLQ